MAHLEATAIRARIQEAREQAGLSQPDMAALLGVITRTVQNYEAHAGVSAKVPYDRLGDIADITGTSLKWLLHGDDDEQTQFTARLDTFDQGLADVRNELASLIGLLTGEPETKATLRDTIAQIFEEAMNRRAREEAGLRGRRRSPRPLGQDKRPAA